MSTQKFKTGQQVIVLNMIVNGERQDMGGTVVRLMTTGTNRGKYELLINSTHICFDESRLSDFESYWQKKNAESK